MAGLLVDLRGQSGGPVDVIAGLGLNHRMEDRSAIDQPWTDLHRCMTGNPPSRNQCAGALLQALAACLREYDSEDFPDVRAAWARFDALADRAVQLHGPGGHVEGIARGLAEDGALRIEVDGRIRRFASGEVSVRAAESGGADVGL